MSGCVEKRLERDILEELLELKSVDGGLVIVNCVMGMVFNIQVGTWWTNWRTWEAEVTAWSSSGQNCKTFSN